ncbi:hypothetical protein D3C80_2017290 [compost metagenome]
MEAVVRTGDVSWTQLEFQQPEILGLQISQQRQQVVRVFFRHVERSEVLLHRTASTTVATTLEHFQTQVKGL